MGKLISQLASTNTFSDSDKLAIEQTNQTVQITLGQLRDNTIADGSITPSKLSEGAPSWDTNGIHILPSNGTNGATGLELNYGVNGNGSAYIDFHSTSATNSDYDARIIKDGGDNSNFRLENKNSGNTTIHQDDKIKFITARGRDGYTTVSGGGIDATDGTKINLYGNLHATKSDQIEYQANQHIFRRADATGESVLIDNGNITAAGTINGIILHNYPENDLQTYGIELGRDETGNVQSYIDFHGTGTDGEYSSRIWRRDNGVFDIRQIGDNPLVLSALGNSDGTLLGANIELYSKSNTEHPGYAYYDADRHIFRRADVPDDTSFVLIESGNITAAGNVTAADPTADTHLATKAYVDAASSINGFEPSSYTGGESVTLPNGLIMKFGKVSVQANTTINIAFGTSFTSAINAQLTIGAAAGPTTADFNALRVYSLSSSGLSVINSNGYSTWFYWMVIGR